MRRVTLSWRRWNEFTSLKPRRDGGVDWTGYAWAWFYLVVER